MQPSKTLKTFGLSFCVCAASLLAPIANAQTPPAMGSGAPQNGMSHSGKMMGGGNAMQPNMASSMDMHSMMTDMNEKMSGMKPSGNTDVDFALMMRVHHQAALTMAEAELKNGKDPQMRVMAKDIIYAQKKEIATFDKFLAKHGESGKSMGMGMGKPDMQMNK